MEFNATFIVSIISFTTFTIIMNAIFYNPLQKVVLERQKFIDDTNEEAKSHKAKSEAILKDKERKLEKSRHEAKKIILDKSNDAKTHKANLATEAHQKANSEIEVAKADLHKSSNEAQEKLTQEAKNIAEQIASKILG
jgi:F-type H+-transporting ATPase subunit b